MKDALSFPSYSEFIQRSEMMKTRQERLIQVRQHEKKMAAQFLDKMKDRAQKQYENTEKYIMNEISELHSKELAAMRRVYEECIMKINQEHYSKAVQSKVNHSRSNIHLPNSERNFVPRKNLTPVKTIIIHDESGTTMTANPPLPKFAITEQKENRKSLSPEKKISSPKILSKDSDLAKKTVNPRIAKEDQKKVETRTKSIYHEKCIPDVKRAPSPKRKTFIKKSIQTIPGSTNMNEGPIHKVTDPVSNCFLKKSTEDFLDSYSKRVHDRIRILEQKEKMLQRRIICLPDFNRFAIAQPYKDSATNTEDNVTYEKFKLLNPVTAQPSRIAAPGATEPVDVSKDLKGTFQPVTEKSLKTVLQDAKEPSNKSKEVRNTAVQTSRACGKKKRHCKRASLAKNEDMIIFIRNHRSEMSDVIENGSRRDATVEPLSSNTSRDTESSFSEAGNVSLSVKKIVHTTTNKYGDLPQNKKLANWRKLFSNGEKLSESSYYSPPDPSKRAPMIPTRGRKKKCKRHLLRQGAVKESENDIGYYVAKLLLMSPESLENLNNISEETISSISIDEIEPEKAESVHSTAKEGKTEDESLDEEEFLHRMLEVSIPPLQNDQRSAIPNNKIASSRNGTPVSVSSEKSATITETDVKAGTSSMTLSENDGAMESKLTHYDNDILKNISLDDLKLDSSLSGWIGASIRRTLEASAVNSTSSYDEFDNLRQIDQLVKSLIAKNDYCQSSGKSSSTTQFAFSPVDVPDVRLNVPRIFDTFTR